MPSRDSKNLTPFLQEVWEELRTWYTAVFPERELFLTCTYRSPQEQAGLYKLGRTVKGKVVTMCDGVKTMSKHNEKPARAFDVAVREDGKVVWDEIYFVPIGRAILESKYKDRVRWGGNFKFRDFPHVEEI